MHRMHITVQVQAFIFAVCLMANNADGSRNSIKREGWVRINFLHVFKASARDRANRALFAHDAANGEAMGGGCGRHLHPRGLPF